MRVTDRGVPRAVLMPLPIGDSVDRGVDEGWIVRDSGDVPDDPHPVEPPIGPTTTPVISDDRGE